MRGTGTAPLPWRTCASLGSDDVVPEKFCMVPTQVSVRSDIMSPFEEPVILVLESEPRLLAMKTLKERGVSVTFLKKFSQRAKASSEGTNTFRQICMEGQSTWGPLPSTRAAS